MSVLKKCKVVMLSTKEQANIFLEENITLTYYKYQQKHSLKGIAMNLYIISDDEIKEDDWFIHDNRLFQCGFIAEYIDAKGNPGAKIADDSKRQAFEKDNCKKIVATTDRSLCVELPYGNKDFVLPQPSQSFIDKYITEYNKGNVITEVLVEYEFKKNVVFGNMSFIELNDDGSHYKCINCEVENTKSREYFIQHGCNVDSLKISKDNTITIKKIKNSWSRDEIISLLYKHTEDMFKQKVTLDKWIEENL